MLWGNRDTADDPAVLGNDNLSNTQQPDAEPSQSPDDLSDSPAAETPFQNSDWSRQSPLSVSLPTLR